MGSTRSYGCYGCLNGESDDNPNRLRGLHNIFRQTHIYNHHGCFNTFCRFFTFLTTRLGRFSTTKRTPKLAAGYGVDPVGVSIGVPQYLDGFCYGKSIDLNG